MRKVSVSIKGLSPSLMHADTLCDPLHPLSKEIAKYSKKRQKTEEDHLMVAWLDWRGALYWDEDTGPHWPAANIQRMIRDAAALRRKGKDILRAVVFEQDKFPLIYVGPRDPESLFKSENPSFKLRKTVVVQRSRVVRTRPMFTDWSLDFSFLVDESVIDDTELAQYLHDAGRFVALSDWRPLYGKFEVTSVESEKVV